MQTILEHCNIAVRARRESLVVSVCVRCDFVVCRAVVRRVASFFIISAVPAYEWWLGTLSIGPRFSENTRTNFIPLSVRNIVYVRAPVNDK